MIVKRVQALWPIVFAAVAISVAPGQDNHAARNSAEARQSASLESIDTTLGEPLRVVCKGNQLAIAANGATLGLILNEVQKCTGAKLDVPSGAADLRFYDTIGPHTLQRVLLDLLSATGYNFVIAYSDSDHDKVEEVSLTVRGNSSADSVNESALSPARRVFLKMRQDALTEAGIATDDSTSSSVGTPASSASVQPESGTEVNSAASPSVSPDRSQGSAPSSPAPGPQDNAPPSGSSPESTTTSDQPKAIDDQITRMQQMFEQRRQMMQSPSSPSTPPQN
jgi:hypothetical protein